MSDSISNPSIQDERQQLRAKEFKRGIDADEARAKRGDGQLQLRKNKREENLRKRRQQPAPGAAPDAPQAAATGLRMSEVQVRNLHSPDPNVVEQATIHFRKLLSLEKNPPIRDVIEMGIVPRLVELLTVQSHPNLQYEAAWALTNIASGSSEETKVVVDSGALPIFVQLLQSQSEKVREQAIWALGNIAGDSARLRDICLSLGMMEPLLHNVRTSNKLSLTRNAAWTLSNLCRGKPKPDFNAVRNCIPVLRQLVDHTDKEVLTDACWALSYISDGDGERIEAVVRSGALPRLVQLLKNNTLSIQTPALRTVGNVVTGTDTQTQAALDCPDIMPCLIALLNSTRKVMRKESTWTISNILAGKPAQIQLVINAQIIPIIVRHLASAEWEIRKEAGWALANALSGGTPEQSQYLIECGAIKPMSDLLLSKNTPIPLLKVTLHGIEVMLSVGKKRQESLKFGAGDQQNYVAAALEDCGALDTIELLQNHPDDEVYGSAVRIIETYFGDDDGEENLDGLAPQAPGGGANMQLIQPPPQPFHFGQPDMNAVPFGGFGGFGGAPAAGGFAGFGGGASNNTGFSF